MMQTMFYVCLDVLATILEITILYTCNTIFCKKNKKTILGFLPYMLSILLASVMTWVIPLGAVKMFTIAVFYLILQWLILKEKWYKLVMSYSLYFMLLILNDFLSLSLADLIFGHTSIMLGNIVVNIWQEYLIKFLMIGIINFILYKMFGKFVYEIQPKDAAISLVYCIIAWFVMYYSTGHGYFSGNVNWFDFTIGISGLLLDCLLIVLFLNQKNSNYLKYQKEIAQQKVQEMELKHAYYQDKLKDEERVRSIYHDLKNHLLILQEQQSDSQKPKQLIESLQAQISSFENYQLTGNEFLDIILHDKAETAKAQNTDFSVVVRFEDGGFISPLDISTIFGNAIDNALEASMKLPVQQRLVTIKAKRFRDMLSIVFKNNMLPAAEHGINTTKNDLFLHGFGLKNIQQVVEKYAGQFTVHQEQGAFILKIIIPIP